MTVNDNSVRMRSIYAASFPDDAESQGARRPAAEGTRDALEDEDPEAPHGGSVDGGREDAPRAEEARGPPPTGDGDEDKDDGGDEEEDIYASEPEPVNLPASTHTLLFTQPVFSIPFAFSISIVVISLLCLAIAFTDNIGIPLEWDIIPMNVTISVRIAQYLGILIALLMEEEIPTGVHLLRMIPLASFKKQFPDRSYRKFVAAALLRIVLGYIFLINVLVIILKARGVLDIFFDVLALKFIAELDDIAFSLSKLDVLGKKLQRACTAKLFQTEFEKQKFGRSKKASLFLKSVYLLNLIIFLAPVIIVSVKQTKGHYQCDRITIDFGDDVWEDAVVELPPDEYGEVQYEERLLPFSTFNGIYEKSGTEFGRPVYVERRKYDREPYKQNLEYSKTPAEIKYSNELQAWIFTHPGIGKKKGEQIGSWLLKSPETAEYDLLSVEREWKIWFGRIETTHLSYSCTKCNSDTDCNLNGHCDDNGMCKCNEEDETKYLGPLCEVKLKNSCRTIVDEVFNTSWSIQYYARSGSGPCNTLFEMYDRPVYSRTTNFPGDMEDDINWLMYTGRRWVLIDFSPKDFNATAEQIVIGKMNYHAFWDQAFRENPFSLNLISDPTTRDTPVGVDWFEQTEWGNQFGPFGMLEPVDETVGRGLFRCAGQYTPVGDNCNAN